MNIEEIWIFSGAGGRFPSGVFRDKRLAMNWIRERSLTGVLTLYPVDVGTYEWAIANGHFHVSKSAQSTPEFIQMFSSANQDHVHFEDGKLASESI